jgi:pimeloyl-ACP methyl ester carboxylesterase
MPTVTLNGNEIFYRDAGPDNGTASAVLLLHASSSSSGQWKPLITDLARDHRVVAPDRQGYGASAPLPSPLASAILHDAAQMTELVTRLAAMTGGPVHVVGHSSGGVVASLVAHAARDHVASLCLIEPVLVHLADPGDPNVADFIAIGDQVMEMAKQGDAPASAPAFIDYWNGHGAWDQLPGIQQRYIADGMARVAQEFSAMRQLTAPRAADFTALDLPTLLVQGTRTTAAAAAIMARLRDILPDATSAAIGQAGHMSPLTHPCAINPFITGFIRRLTAQPLDLAA